MAGLLGIDCGSVSLNLVLLRDGLSEPLCLYRRIRGGTFRTLFRALEELHGACGCDLSLHSAMVTGSGRDLFSRALGIPAVNEITAHATGALRVNPEVRTVIELGGQDSKFILIKSPEGGGAPRVAAFRMNEVCAAGTGAFLDEQADRLGISVDSYGALALHSQRPAPIAGRCAVFAKTDMIHQAQEGAAIPDILMGLAFALVRNYLANLVRGDALQPVISLQGGVMNNEAVVKAFRTLLDAPDDKIIIPPHFEVLGALGCAALGGDREAIPGLTLGKLVGRAAQGGPAAGARSFSARLAPSPGGRSAALQAPAADEAFRRPLVMGLDVGSVSVKGVILDADGRIIRDHYMLSRSRPLDAVGEVTEALTRDGASPDALAVTGSGRRLVGRLLDAEFIVNEIMAQAGAAASFDPQVETVVEIGGQDSKWISLEDGMVRDFEMNRVCAAGTGSFLMAQAARLGLEMGREFSDAAFASERPADLGTRCTVFMESDLIHHQNSGASVEDLAAGVCMSVAQNYMETVANHKPMGERVLFLGGVAGNEAVRAALERHTGKRLSVPYFHKVSGAYGAAVNALEAITRGDLPIGSREAIKYDPSGITTEAFQCRGCANECRIRRYRHDGRTLFNGGLCDRWEADTASVGATLADDPFAVRARLLEEYSENQGDFDTVWGMGRSPQFYQWFPFWQAFCNNLGVKLIAPERANRKQFERGAGRLGVETCLPMKVLAGQFSDLQARGVDTIFHPAILSERPDGEDGPTLIHCPYVQASSQLFRGAFDLQWRELAVNSMLDPDALWREHARFATNMGFSRERAALAIEVGLATMEEFRKDLHAAGARFLHSLGEGEKALVVLGKPYHTANPFLNMNLSGVFQRLGVRAMPSDIFPLAGEHCRGAVSWRYQSDMVRVAEAVAESPNLFPVFITFFGCGPDPFTLRHIRDALNGKPLLILEMDEHSSRAGMITRVEAFWEELRRRPTPARAPREEARPEAAPPVKDNPDWLPAFLSRFEKARKSAPQPMMDERSATRTQGYLTGSEKKPEVLYMPFIGNHAYALAASARSFGIDARVLPHPDEESQRLGRPHAVGGECHPYLLILGDYLKLVQSLTPDQAQRSRFYVLSADACRLGQYPVYIDKIRRQLGYGVGIIFDVSHGLESFGLSTSSRGWALLRTWEAVNAYELLDRALQEIRPRVGDPEEFNRVDRRCGRKLFDGISQGKVQEGLEDALHELAVLSRNVFEPGPQVVVTGDYYTRIVPFANNDVFKEVEALGGTIKLPPLFSDCFKMSVLRDSVWSLRNGQTLAAARHGLFYMMMAVSELRVKGFGFGKSSKEYPSDISGLQLWRTVASQAETRLPAGITAPMATALQQVESNADGVLNLMTLNCSFGSVVTAALSRALKDRPWAPMLTLVYDGLKKTNEKTRIEAFMEQASEHFRVRRDLESRNRSWGGASMFSFLRTPEA